MSPKKTQASEGPQRVGFSRVAPDYFRTLKLPLLRGRDFTSSDLAAASAPVAIVNETLARRFWPDGDALGKRIRSRKTLIEIIGIAADAKYLTLADASRPWLYRPNHTESRPDSENPALSLAVRASGDPAHLRAAIRREVQHLVPDWPVFQFRNLSEGIELQRLVPRVGATLLGVLGTFGLILAAIGVYGVVAHAVTQRTREIGIRIALGAQHCDVMLLIIRQGMTVCTIGAAVGIVLALAVSQVLGSLLYGIGASDPPTYLTVVAVLLAVALLACYLPARRARACCRSRRSGSDYSSRSALIGSTCIARRAGDSRRRARRARPGKRAATSVSGSCGTRSRAESTAAASPRNWPAPRPHCRSPTAGRHGGE